MAAISLAGLAAISLAGLVVIGVAGFASIGFAGKCLGCRLAINGPSAAAFQTRQIAFDTK